MALPQEKPYFDLASYFAWEETQEERHEYWQGEVFAMSGGTDTHYTVLLNLATALKAEFSGTPCRPFVSGMKVNVEAADAVFYPDVFVTCHPADRLPEANMAKSHPVFIAEVLSASTAAYDRSRKFELYQQIPELQEYLLIEQDRRHADLFRKNAEGFWVLHPYGESGVISLESLNVQVPMSTLYADTDVIAG